MRIDGRKKQEVKDLIKQVNIFIRSLKNLSTMSPEDLGKKLSRYTQTSCGQEIVTGVVQSFHGTKVCMR